MKVSDEVLLDGGGPKPRDRVLIRHRRRETRTHRRSHVETEAETGGRRPPAQGWTPGAPRSWKRQEGHHDLKCLFSRTRGGSEGR